MDFAQLTIRDWMVIAGVLLILVVLLDAFRRVRNERNAAVRIKLVDPEGDAGDGRVDLAWLRELPNGGARTVERDSEEAASAVCEPLPSAGHDSTPPAATVDQVELVTGMNATDEPENLDWLDSLDTPDTSEPSTAPVTGQTAPEAQRLPRQPAPEVFMLNVVARDPAGFSGADILHILLACDLRFGDMSFFHRYEREAGLGEIQFSVANMMQPGVFDIDHMSDMYTPGLVFFLTLPGPQDMMQAFEYMLETAQAVARNLDGDVLDETRSAITPQVREHSRQKILDLERRMLAQSEP